MSHFAGSARIGTRGGVRVLVRVAVGTVSTTEHRLFKLQWQSAWQKPGQGPGGPSGGVGMKVLPPLFQTSVTLTLAALKIRECDLDSGTRKKSVRATVKVAMEKEQRRGQERCPR